MSAATNGHPDPDTLTPRQRSVLRFIEDSIDGRGYAPTFREIGAEFDINSPNGVKCHLTALARKGFIRRGEYMARAITLVHRGPPCPHCGGSGVDPDPPT